MANQDKSKYYIYKANSNKGIKVPLECAVKGEELVRDTIKAKSPLELAEVFSVYSYMNSEIGDRIFYYALDMSERTAHTLKSLETQDNLYFLNLLDYAKNKGLITSEYANKAAQLFTFPISELNKNKI